ncbi:related to transcription elongation factor TFIIS [Cephalotrichum gorgonifer]|uniref:Transcription elongation factor n=1 Tax=Cephalotrichum gorgonifer TaxID=2041049 RepID=A0AAE8MZN5_9PEZI|nr:related to transcription elongation factor TFIIS [Cephalotrichum gorgonifer]
MMDQRELEARVKALTKSIGANEPASNALTLLKSLKDEAAPTEEMLRATKAGVFVGKLRSHQNKEIAVAATQLVQKWKKLVEAEKASKARISKMNSPVSASTSIPAPATGAASSSTAAAAGSSKSTGFKGDPEKRRAETDKVDTNRTSSNIRNNCIKLMYNGLAYRSTETPEVVLSRAVAVEDAAFKSFSGETKEYREKLRSLFQNLKNRTNAELGRKVMSGDITADRFVTMSADELKSAEQREKDSFFEKENMKNAQVPTAEKSVTSEFKCSKCGQRKVAYTQAQTRSADEPMTTFCECTICGNRWKFS